MNLYLSSLGIPNTKALHELLGKSSGIKVASIRPGWNTYPKQKVDKWSKDADTLFKNIGATAKVINLEKYAGKPAELQDKLSECDLVWVHGGNSFYISYWMKQSNFKTVLSELFKRGLTYGGESAGAVVVCPNLHGIELADDPSDAPEPVYEGLNLVDFAIVPHWGNEAFQPVLVGVKTESDKYNKKVLTIADDECLVVRDGVVERFNKS